jgi:hypothetical protein
MAKLHLTTAAAYPGAILHTIVTAIMAADCQFYASDCGWDGTNYWAYNQQSATATFLFSFSPSIRVVGGFFDAKSDRSPYHWKEYSLDFVLREMPDEHRLLLMSGLPLYFERMSGTDIPCITAAFWDEGEYLASADSWDALLANGARLVRIQLLGDHDEAIKEWSTNFGMAQQQESFVRKLFKRKLAQPEGIVELSGRETAWLVSTSEDPEGEGIAACRNLLAKIGIRMS